MPERSEDEKADTRSDLAKARDEWFDSQQGQTCAGGLAEGVYLRNRLETAFVSGWLARGVEADRLKAELAEARKETDRLNRWIQDHCYVEDGLTTEAALSAAQKKIHILTAERDEARKLVAEFRVLLTLCKQAAAEDEIQSSSLLEGMREADTALAALEGKEGANG